MNERISSYFTNNRIRWFISCFIFLLLGVAPLLPNISGSGQYNLLDINKESHSLLFYFSESGFNFYYYVIALYYIGGIVLTVFGALIPPRKLFCGLLLAFSGVFLAINLLSAGFIFLAVSLSGITETVSLTVWSIIYLVLQTGNITNLIQFLFCFKKR